MAFSVESGRFHAAGNQTFTVLERWTFLAEIVIWEILLRYFIGEIVGGETEPITRSAPLTRPTPMAALRDCCRTVLKSRPVKTWGRLTVVAMQCLDGQWRKKRN
jgi:hypothetical protein